MIRPYVPADCPRLAELFYNTVHCVNARDYSPEQLDAWATGEVDLEAWNQSFLQHHTLVAEKNGKILGFGNIARDGYLDRLYVHKDCQRQGIATALCDALEACIPGAVITTHASITAKTFFHKTGIPCCSKANR